VRCTVVGCSGSLPGPESPASCYLVEAEDATGRTWQIALDLGSGALGVLQRHVGLADLDAVLLSHLHPDHFLDLCGYYVALRFGPDRRDARLPVYGPEGTGRRLAEAYGLPRDSGMGSEMDVRSWRERVPVRIGPFTVTPVRVRHPVESYGLRVEGPAHDGRQRVLAYTGDTDDCPALDDLARDADLLLAEAAFHEGRDEGVRGIHLTGRRAGQVAARTGAARLVLTHVPPWNDADLALREAREVYDGPLDVAMTGAVLEV
jgi:ribonuclease BN (tRNA processing enzyme)